MDAIDYIHKRKGRYMAQVLEHFEEHIEPLIDKSDAGKVQDFKGLLRARINALAVDAEDLLKLDGEQNGLALDFRDTLQPTS